MMNVRLENNTHIGPSFDEVLAEEGILAEVYATALKRVLAWQVRQGMAEKHLSKSAMARVMRSSRTVSDRLLDPTNEAITLRILNQGSRRSRQTVQDETGINRTTATTHHTTSD
jgi:antitoxin HicB